MGATAKRNKLPIGNGAVPRLLELLTETDLVGVIGVRDRHIVWANGEFARMAGYGVEEVIGRPTRAFYESDEAYAEYGRVAYAAIEAGKTMRQPMSLVRKDGSVGHFMVTARAASPGNPVSYGIFVDISDKVRLEGELRKAKRRLETALWGADLATWVADLPSGELVFDDRWCAIVGFGREEIDATVDGWERRVHPEDLARIHQVVAAHRKGETPGFLVEYRYRHKDGHWLWLRARAKSERDAEGRPVRYAGVVGDVTQERRMINEGSELLARFRDLIDELAQGATAGRGGSLGTGGGPEAALTLSRRQRQVLALIAGGSTSPEIAQRLHISQSTVLTHRRNLMRRLDLHSAAGLTRYAVERGIVAG